MNAKLLVTRLFFAVACVVLLFSLLIFKLQNTSVAKASRLAEGVAAAPAAIQSCLQVDASDLPKTIVDNSTITSTLSVTTSLVITDVNIRQLNINHTYDSDLTAYLIGPSGTSVKLFANVGGNSDQFINTVLDDAAVAFIQDGAAPFTGAFSPVESLSAFNGQSTFGSWKLAIHDGNSGDDGTLVGWQIELCGDGDIPTETPVPPTNTPVPTAINTNTPTAISTPSATSTVATSTPIATAPTSMPTLTPVATATTAATATSVPATATSVPATATSVSATATSVPATATSTPNTPAPATPTTVPATATPTTETVMRNVYLPIVAR